MASSVVDTPTFSDLKWWDNEGVPDAFSSAMYDAFNDFENYLLNAVKDQIDTHFEACDQQTRSLLAANTLRLLRCVPAGALDTSKFLKLTPPSLAPRSRILTSLIRHHAVIQRAQLGF